MNSLDWDSPIYVDTQAKEYILFKENEDVSFTVSSFEKSANNDNKIAKLILKCKNADNLECNVYCNLHLKNEEKNLKFIANFFASIGLPCQKDSYENPLPLRWGEVLGSRGNARITHEKSDNGNTYNRIKFFLNPDEVKAKTDNSDDIL